jgi:hypothetical protein
MKSLAFLVLGAAVSGLFLTNFVDVHQLTHVVNLCPKTAEQEKAACEERQERSDRHRQAVARERANKLAEQRSLGVAENLKRLVVHLPAQEQVDVFNGWSELQLEAGQVVSIKITGAEQSSSAHRVLIRAKPDCQMWLNNEKLYRCWPFGEFDFDDHKGFEIKGRGTILLQAASR